MISHPQLALEAAIETVVLVLSAPGEYADHTRQASEVAVTERQIVELNLPTRPTKKSDSRSKNWNGDDSVELDAIPPNLLRQLVRDAIERHTTPERLASSRQQKHLNAMPHRPSCGSD